MFTGPRRTLRWREQGFTLVEMFVTISLVSIGVLGIMYAVASAQQSATTNQQQAQLESAMRQVSDFIRDSRATTGMSYSVCATAAVYNNTLATSSNRPAKPTGIDWTIDNVYVSTAGSRSPGGATSPITLCSGSTGDWGVQEIAVRVCTPVCNPSNKAVHLLTRTVWKADA